jgi:hypothetical protein
LTPKSTTVTGKYTMDSKHLANTFSSPMYHQILPLRRKLNFLHLKNVGMEVSCFVPKVHNESFSKSLKDLS